MYSHRVGWNSVKVPRGPDVLNVPVAIIDTTTILDNTGREDNFPLVAGSRYRSTDCG